MSRGDGYRCRSSSQGTPLTRRALILRKGLNHGLSGSSLSFFNSLASRRSVSQSRDDYGVSFTFNLCNIQTSIILKLDKRSAIFKPWQNLRYFDGQVLRYRSLHQLDWIHDTQRGAIEALHEVRQLLICFCLATQQRSELKRKQICWKKGQVNRVSVTGFHEHFLTVEKEN